VVIFGDVDPRQFTDYQLQLIHEFLTTMAGGFAMVSGPRWSPVAYKNTVIKDILPVNISRAVPDSGGDITQGFRPILTPAGEDSSIFRFFADKKTNDAYFKDQLPVLFWYQKGISVKDGVGEVYPEHPTDTDPDGRRKAPIFVVGRYGMGRTIFSAIDDSWRWRFYTGETVFDTYWIQQIRYLARSKKLAQRGFTIALDRSNYELGEQVKASLRILNPRMLRDLPEQLRVEVIDSATNRAVRQEMLVRQPRQPDVYDLSFTADRTGSFSLRLLDGAGGITKVQLPLTVSIPRLELAEPEVDRTMLTRIASETLGTSVSYDDAPAQLPRLLPSAARILPLETSRPLWDAPLVLAVFVVLITTEWIARKKLGML
jgi:hypothetical protein